MFKVLMVVAALFTSPSAQALQLPQNLSAADRIEVLKTLGAAASTKYLTNPYPLGGYSGFELGINHQTIDSKSLLNLGSQNTNDKQLTMTELSIGKGLFNDIDVFFNFAPFESDMSTFGGFLRYSFYQAKFFPLNLSVLLTGNTLHVGDQFVSQTLGTEALAGVNVDNLAIYIGYGRLETKGLFMGGAGNESIVSPTDPVINTNTQTASEKIAMNHVFVGTTIHLSSLFFAFQVDRYEETSYSGKIGLRF